MSPVPTNAKMIGMEKALTNHGHRTRSLQCKARW